MSYYDFKKDSKEKFKTEKVTCNAFFKLVVEIGKTRNSNGRRSSLWPHLERSDLCLSCCSSPQIATARRSCGCRDALSAFRFW